MRPRLENDALDFHHVISPQAQVEQPPQWHSRHVGFFSWLDLAGFGPRGAFLEGAEQTRRRGEGRGGVTDAETWRHGDGKVQRGRRGGGRGGARGVKNRGQDGAIRCWIVLNRAKACERLSLGETRCKARASWYGGWPGGGGEARSGCGVKSGGAVARLGGWLRRTRAAGRAWVGRTPWKAAPAPARSMSRDDGSWAKG